MSPSHVYGLMTLGQLIDFLEQLCKPRRVDPEDGTDPSTYRVVTTGGTYVGGFSSYRGYYEDLALVPIRDRDGMHTKSLTAGELLQLARECDGKTFTGYKGGEYRMTRDNPLWISARDDASSIGLEKVELHGSTVVLFGKPTWDC